MAGRRVVIAPPLQIPLLSPPVPSPASIRVGTSSFTASGWQGTFYPANMQPRDFLTYYSTKFDTVEVDSTFYGTPAVSTVKNWAQKTPANFLFALKVPQVITHEKCLADCAAEFDRLPGRRRTSRR